MTETQAGTAEVERSTDQIANTTAVIVEVARLVTIIEGKKTRRNLNLK
jgi:hypothetical protein